MAKTIRPEDAEKIYAGKGALNKLPLLVKAFGGKKVFVLADVNTYRAAGEKVCKLLEENDIRYTSYIVPDKAPEPDEHTVGSVIMHFDVTCDLVVGVGSGVLSGGGCDSPPQAVNKIIIIKLDKIAIIFFIFFTPLIYLFIFLKTLLLCLSF